MITLRKSLAIAVLLSGLGGILFGKSKFWAQVTFVKGAVVAAPAGGGEGRALTLGMVLHQGDRVTVPDGAMASLLLNDGGILVLRPGPETVLEPAKKIAGPSMQKVAENLASTLLTREGNNPMLKHLTGLRASEQNLALAPNRTKVRTGPVTLVWRSYPGTQQYAVTVMGPGDLFYEGLSRECRLVLPAEKIVPASTYYWEVRDAEAKDTIVPLGSGSFSTLDKAVEVKVRDLEASVQAGLRQAADLDPSAAHFLLYQIYRQHGLGLDALFTLEKMAAAAPADETLIRWRRELCQDMELQDPDIPKLLAY